jgi:PilZ domain-containing protein
MKERRAEPRLWCSDLIKVRLESAGGEPAELMANLEDISPSGACAQFEQAVPAGARLCLALGRHKFRGRVTHCTHNEIGYFVGIRFDAGKKWSRQIYEPKHLLDPMEVMGRKR